MGSAESAGALHITTNSPHYEPRDTIAGTVHLLAAHCVSATAVLLLLKGTENTRWTEERGVARIETCWGKRRIARKTYEIYRFQGTVREGQYDFPFEVTLPRDLPCSFMHRRDPVATITYKLVAKVADASNEILPGVSVLSIIPPISDSISPFTDQQLAQVSTYCCLSKGSIRLNATIDKTAYTPGETAKVSISADNSNCDLAISGLLVSLVRVIRVRSSDGETYATSSVVNFVETEVDVPARCGTVGKWEVGVVVPSDSEVEEATSVSAALIECVYYIEVEALLVGTFTCCSDPPHITKEVTIYSPQMEKPPVPDVQGEWNPLVMETKSFSSGPENEYFA